MTDFDMHSHAHTIGRALAHEFDDMLDFAGYTAADPDPAGDNASALVSLKNGVSVEVYDSTGTGRANVVAEVMATDGKCAYFADDADFADGCYRAVRSIALMIGCAIARSEATAARR